jgi:site-specific recombinase XerC
VIRVAGKGRKERRVPFGMTAGQALRRYRKVVQDLRLGDPFFITRYGERTSRWAVQMMMANCGRAAGIEGVRCSPHALRHTGAKRFILAGGDFSSSPRIRMHPHLGFPLAIRRMRSRASSLIGGLPPAEIRL